MTVRVSKTARIRATGLGLRRALTESPDGPIAGLVHGVSIWRRWRRLRFHLIDPEEHRYTDCSLTQITALVQSLAGAGWRVVPRGSVCLDYWYRPDPDVTTPD